MRLVPDGRVLVRVPPWMSRARVEAWVASRLPSIQRRAARIPRHLICIPQTLADGERVSIVGHIQEISLSGRTEAARTKQLRQLVTNELDRCVQRAVERHTIILGQAPSKIMYRDYRGRLGTCRRPHGVITLHWGLGFLSERHIEAIVAHEMSHLKYGSHGPRFWSTVERLYPAYKVPHDEARMLGPYLRLPR